MKIPKNTAKPRLLAICCFLGTTILNTNLAYSAELPTSSTAEIAEMEEFLISAPTKEDKENSIKLYYQGVGLFR